MTDVIMHKIHLDKGIQKLKFGDWNVKMMNCEDMKTSVYTDSFHHMRYIM